MAKAKLKTEKTKQSVGDFLNAIQDEQIRKDCLAICAMYEKATGDKPKMWGTAIIGFGDVVLKYESGRELDWFKLGFSPRKQNITLYILDQSPAQIELLKKLGKYKAEGGCLYLKSLADVKTDVLQKMISLAAKNKK